MSLGIAAPEIRFPDELPISRERDRIAAALAEHQVLIVCGATGSGKSTQLPKICLAAGRGRERLIGHTQPRRLAAVAVARRIAEELGTELGQTVGYQIRFDERVGDRTHIKLMTDGILLNEIRGDRDLSAYDTLIVDEAHERTVNIDFVLAYLKLLLRRRKDLKLIVTSATVDASAFAAYFGAAPVIDVEGVTYPVETEYRAPADDEDLSTAVSGACRALAARPVPGGDPSARDILVFLPGERFIEDAATELQRSGPPGYEILPLYARLSATRQQRVFRPGPRPRIILATNVAETSLTVPRIRYVVDSGLARIKRYSTRHRIDTLRIEPIAQANAQQRAGRCGRIAPGVCIRLYSRDDFEARPEFTDPEILRTNLAGALLQLKTLGLGSFVRFPLLDRPDDRYVNDAERLLQLLGATDRQGRLTKDGRLMARLPVDPRVARLLLAGRRQRCLRAAITVAAALSAADPRESQGADDEAARRGPQHAYMDQRSDFLTYVNLAELCDRTRRQGRKALRALCAQLGLAERRLQEWDDLQQQLLRAARGLGWQPGRHGTDYVALHKAILAAFVDYLAERDEEGSYRGMFGIRSRLHPGSVLARKPPRWIVAAEHVATERNYLRIAARINPRWVREVAPHVVSREIGQPEWDEQRGRVIARETVSAFGLVLQSDRRVDYGPVDPAVARQIFIEAAFAEGRLGAVPPCVGHNRRLREQIFALEARQRSRDLYLGDRALGRFYDERLPVTIRARAEFLAWCEEPGHDALLRAQLDDLSTHDVAAALDAEFPQTLTCAGHPLELVYRYEPGDDADGITLRLPTVLIDSLPPERLEWLVPGHLREKVLALLRTLPKELRRPLVPLPDTVDRIMPALRNRFGGGALCAAIAEAIATDAAVIVPPGALDDTQLPAHLRFRVELIGADGATVAAGRDFVPLRRRYGGAAAADEGRTGAARAEAGKVHTTWSFGDLPLRVPVRSHGTTLELYPAVVPCGRGVRIELLPPGPGAEEQHRDGIRKLLLLAVPQQAGLLRDSVRDDRTLLLAYHGLGTEGQLVEDLLSAAAEAAFSFDPGLRTELAFRRCLDAGRAKFVTAGEAVLALLREVLPLYRQARAGVERIRPELDAAADDMSRQLDELVYRGFLVATPPEWLVHLPRYLRAIARRCEGLRYRNARAASDQALVEKAERRLREFESTRPAGWPLPPPVLRYRWLIEELRVSLFAQDLGTVVPVSHKRLARHWSEEVCEALDAAN